VSRRVGVFGGTFDPPHVGHLVVAVNVFHELRLDRLLLVVANDPWQKSTVRAVTPALDRLAMVQAAVAEMPGLEASDLEIRRGGTSFTADTLAEVQAHEPGAQLFLVLGSDAVSGLGTWDRVDEVQRLAELAVVTRPGSEAVVPPPGFRWIAVETPRLDVSSTDLRARVRDGRPLDYLLTGPVRTCIDRRALYRS
jgi:nicotinate-nucleotide adenylyltransferase